MLGGGGGGSLTISTWMKFGEVLPEKGKFCNPTLADITCSRIRTT